VSVAGAGVRPSETLARVETELRTLLTAAGPGPSARGQAARAMARTMNLVVVASTPEGATGWLPVVDAVLQALPARAIVVGLDPDGQDALDAETTAICTPGEGGGPIVCSERVTLVARGSVCERLPSCVAALCWTDVPTTLVWLGRVHADDPAFEPLARDASRIVLDAGQGSLGSLASVVEWARARPEGDRPGVADLAWTRLAAWHELCARFFDEPRLRPLASHVTRVTLAQASPAGAPLGPEASLMLGWLATRLGWKAASLAGKLRLVGSAHAHAQVQTSLRAEPTAVAPRDALVAVALEAAAGDLSVRAEVRRGGDKDAATWRLDVTTRGETQRIEQHVRLQPGEPAKLLERTLHRRTHDPALAEVAAWVDELRGEDLTCA
jgi:glucose-6-phosphate dehydrogenase assembly protein OpcA